VSATEKVEVTSPSSVQLTVIKDFNSKKMGPERDPIRPLGVKHKGIASLKEHGYAPCDRPV
jgi:hypothetical protein